MLLKKLSVAALVIVGVIALGAAFTGLTSVSAVPADQGAKSAPIALPKDPKAEIIVLSFAGGLLPPREGAPPLVVRADGSVAVNMGRNVLDAKLTHDELQALLRFIIDKNRFFDFDAKKVEDELRGDGVFAVVSDGLTTTIKIKTADKEHTVSYYALDFAVQTHPKNKQLAELLAVQRRLERVMTVAQVGGEKVLDDVLKLANQHMKAKFPQAEPLTDADRQSAGLALDGIRHFKFYRAGKAQGTYVIVEIALSKEGEPKVTVQGKQ